MDLTVVLPAYQAAGFVEGRLALLAEHLARGPFDHEVVVVDDGSADGTGEVVRALGLPRVRVVRLDRNRGKYGAIKAGVFVARGRCCVTTDVDVPYELGAVDYLAHQVLDRDVHVAIGDRTLPGSLYGTQQTLLRRGLTAVFSTLVRLFHTGGLADTQCGIKAFRTDVARALFEVLHEERFAGDLELLYVALKHNLEVKRVPVRLVYQAPSSVRPLVDGPRLCLALAKLRARYWTGRYRSARLARLGLQDYWNEPGYLSRTSSRSASPERAIASAASASHRSPSE